MNAIKALTNAIRTRAVLTQRVRITAPVIRDTLVMDAIVLVSFSVNTSILCGGEGDGPELYFIRQTSINLWSATNLVSGQGRKQESRKGKKVDARLSTTSRQK